MIPTTLITAQVDPGIRVYTIPEFVEISGHSDIDIVYDLGISNSYQQEITIKNKSINISIGIKIVKPDYLGSSTIRTFTLNPETEHTILLTTIESILDTYFPGTINETFHFEISANAINEPVFIRRPIPAESQLPTTIEVLPPVLIPAPIQPPVVPIEPVPTPIPDPFTEVPEPIVYPPDRDRGIDGPFVDDPEYEYRVFRG